MDIKRGEIYYINLYPTTGTEQIAGRPFVVVAPTELIKDGYGALCAPLTTKHKKRLPQHTIITATGIPSIVLCEQMRYIDASLFGDYCGTVSKEEMANLDNCLLEAVGVPPKKEPAKNEYAELKREFNHFKVETEKKLAEFEKKLYKPTQYKQKRFFKNNTYKGRY